MSFLPSHRILIMAAMRDTDIPVRVFRPLPLRRANTAACVGLRSTPATPMPSIVTKNDRLALDTFRKRHNAKLSAMAD